MTPEDIFLEHLGTTYNEAYLWQQMFAAAYATKTTGLSDVACQFHLALERDHRVKPRQIELAVERAISKKSPSK